MVLVKGIWRKNHESDCIHKIWTARLWHIITKHNQLLHSTSIPLRFEAAGEVGRQANSMSRKPLSSLPPTGSGCVDRPIMRP